MELEVQNQSADFIKQVPYASEVGQIISKYGDLEDMREHLGLSRRAICQQLLVDPSAWSRWTKAGQAPAYVYQAIANLIYIEKLRQGEAPGLSAPAEKPSQWSLELDELQMQMAQMKTEKIQLSEQLLRREYVSASWKIILVMNSIALLLLALFW